MGRGRFGVSKNIPDTSKIPSSAYSSSSASFSMSFILTSYSGSMMPSIMVEPQDGRHPNKSCSEIPVSTSFFSCTAASRKTSTGCSNVARAIGRFPARRRTP